MSPKHGRSSKGAKCPIHFFTAPQCSPCPRRTPRIPHSPRQTLPSHTCDETSEQHPPFARRRLNALGTWLDKRVLKQQGVVVVFPFPPAEASKAEGRVSVTNVRVACSTFNGDHTRANDIYNMSYRKNSPCVSSFQSDAEQRPQDPVRSTPESTSDHSTPTLTDFIQILRQCYLLGPVAARLP